MDTNVKPTDPMCQVKLTSAIFYIFIVAVPIAILISLEEA